ncbi:MAG: hypothetical protein ACYC5Y_03225 [Symbiobacteriia bacterium]
MLKLRTRYRWDYLVGESYYGSAAEIQQNEFDVGLCVSSWEQRCTAMTAGHMTFDRAGLIVFEQAPEHEGGPGAGVVPKYDAILRKFLEEHSQNGITEVRGDVKDLRGVFGKIAQFIRSTREEKGRPLRLFMDITTCPKYYFLGVLGLCVREALCDRITFHYAEAQYTSEEGDGQYVFTRGPWETVTVPFFAGSEEGDYRFYLPSLGFEGSLALRLISKYEPDRVSLLMPDPGFTTEYTTKAWENNRALREQYCIPDEQIVRAHAADAMEAWKNLGSPQLYRPSETISLLCLGTKPHALALGLKALTNPEIQVLYNVPRRFAPVDHRYNGTSWLYSLQDFSLMP